MRSRRTGALVLVASLLLWDAGGLTAEAKVTCQGKDRWSVKTGTDADAGQVDLDLAHATTKTVVQLRAIPVPSKRPPDRRADATETTVFSVTAFLINYKREPDQDYHLVISDANNNRMVVEVPSKECIKGASPFTTRIVATRQAVDDRFTVKGSFAPTDVRVPVQVVGVGFFDKKGHGTGGTPNGIEIHPVLQLVFDPSGTPTPATPPISGATTQLLRDGGFEGGSAAWTASESVITTNAKKDAHSGKAYAWLGGYGKVHTDTLSQQITLPSAASRITLTYWIAIDTKEKQSQGSFESTDAFDTLTLEVRAANGQRETVAEYSNVHAHTGYIQATADLTSYKGQTIVIAFTAVEDKSLQTSFMLDDIGVDAQ
jgi:hypothetical protein